MEETALLTCLKGVGPRIENLLQNLGLVTVQDLLFHLPSRYQDRTRITPINSVREGDHVLVEGDIRSCTLSPGRQPSLLCEIQDVGGSIYCRFFHFTAQQKNQLSVLGTRLRCFGEIRRAFRHYGFEMIHPEYRLIQSAHELPLDENLTPIYPTTQGLSQSLLRRLTDQALEQLALAAPDLELLPPSFLSQFPLTDLASALRFVHRPPPNAEVDLLLRGEHPAQKRLAFEELIAHQLNLQKIRGKSKKENATSLKSNGSLRKKFLDALRFQLTAAQRRVIEEIDRDLSEPHPMMRLLQGDVGSGKTVVAAMALLSAVEHGTQAALMAPTELLAEQHYKNFSNWFEPLGIPVVYCGGKTSAAARSQVLKKISNAEAAVIIGTHALFQEDVFFSNLSLVIIDEQHRFGVNQRLALLEKGRVSGTFPHQLVMSATPIPRTLTMAAYADLDVSIIDELPPGRKPVITALISNKRRQEVVERVRLACQEGKQAYWVCTLIEDSEALQCQAAEETTQALRRLLPQFRIGLVHSRISSEEKTLQMQSFKNGEMHLLVATTVIEVGVDVPNANLMIIENPERLGLAQLHQLRGRVGRGAAESFCVLLFRDPLSALARQRLEVMRRTNDGFVIAQEDLAMRGPGEILGTRQSGLPQLKMADLLRDQHLLPSAQIASQQLLQHFPQKADALIRRWIPESCSKITCC